MTKQPSYRFADYTDPWEKKKLGDFSDVTKLAGFEFTNHVKYSSTGSIIALRGLNIKNGNIILNDVKYIDESDFSKLNRSKLIINDIMFTYVGTVGELAVIEDNNKFYLAPNVSRIRILNDTYPYFLMQYMWRKSFYQSVIFPLIATSSQPALSMENIRKFNISLPSLPEQTAIGSFFQDIDQHISLQQRKLEVLKDQKKTYLKLLFPVKGQTKPALRFAGFEDDWKEVKLGEVVASERKGKAKSEMIGNKSVYLDTIYLNGGEQTRVDCDCDTSKEDIIILWDGSQAGAVYYGFEGALGSTLKSYKIFGSGSFYYQQMKASQSLIFERYRTPNIPHVIKSFLDDFYIFTTSLPEQEAIGSFFQDLDKAIAKQEEKVNQLKESKQTLLRKMFI